MLLSTYVTEGVWGLIGLAPRSKYKVGLPTSRAEGEGELLLNIERRGSEGKGGESAFDL